MRGLLIAATLLGLAVPGVAQERTRRPATPMATPSIMVEEGSEKAQTVRATGKRATRPATRPARSSRLRPRTIVRSTIAPRGEDQVRSINRSIDLQQQQLRVEQQSQFEANQLRQQLQRDSIGSSGIGSRICSPGSIGC